MSARRRRHEPSAAAGRGAGGWSVVELLAMLGVVAVAAALASPPALAWARRQRLEDATRRLAASLVAERWRALTTARAAGLAFACEPDGRLRWQPFSDGDGDGLRRADMADDTDQATGPEQVLEKLAPGVRAGVLAVASVPRLPPQTGNLEQPQDPLKLGASDLVSFSPAGGATAGSIYLTDGTGMTALVVNGITGRLRLFRFDPARREWKEMF